MERQLRLLLAMSGVVAVALAACSVFEGPTPTPNLLFGRYLPGDSSLAATPLEKSMAAYDAVWAFLASKKECKRDLIEWQRRGYVWRSMSLETSESPKYTVTVHSPEGVVAAWSYRGPEHNVVPVSGSCGKSANR
ncbi:MAG: hypothetical protein HYY01_00650 [Chloroflexi bacterium]|nr:hypothetical protein [Chloroflexota bacterium]